MRAYDPSKPIYANRDVLALNKHGNVYVRHVEAMTAEGLHSKSDIAAELAYRDVEIERLRGLLLALLEVLEPECRLDHHGNCQAHFIESPCRVATARAALGAADQPAAAPKPKRAYYETHEPPHCPTCECWQEITPDNSPAAE